MTIQESDILFFAGGAALQQFGTFTRRTMVPRRGGEEDVETFTRSGAVGVLRSRDGFLHTAEANTPRVWWDGTRYNLLLERAGTNLCIQSEDITTSWSNVRTTDSANTTAGPDGLTMMDDLIEDATASTTHYIESTAFTVTASAVLPASLFAKGDTRDWICVEVSDETITDAYRCWFDVSNGTVGSNAVAGTGVFTQATIEAHGNGTYRCHMSGTVSADTSVRLRVYMADADNSISFSGDGVSKVQIWGAHVEDDVPEVSSYISTTTVAVTRNADLFTVPYYHGPQLPGEQWYCAFAEGDATGSNRPWQISTAGGSDPRLFMDRNVNDYRMVHDPATATASSATLTPSVDDFIELLGTLNPDGSTVIAARKNGGSTVTGSTSTAQTIVSPWSGPLMTIGSGGAANAGVRRYHALIGTRGTGQTFADFTALLP